MECDQIRELLEAYALGVLDANEQAMVEQHLAGCPDCQRLAKEYADAANTLPRALASASALRVPDSIKTRLFQSLEAGPPPRASSTSLDEKPGRARSERRVPGWWRPRTAAALAAIIVTVLSLAWSAQLSVALAQERALRAELANLVGQQEIVLEVVDSSKSVKAFLRPPGSGSPSYGKLYTRPDLPNVVAMAARLPSPPAGESYHLWLTGQGQVQLAGVMAVNSEGFGLLVFEADYSGPVYEAAQLTLQPEGGAAPAGVLVLSWKAPE